MSEQPCTWCRDEGTIFAPCAECGRQQAKPAAPPPDDEPQEVLVLPAGARVLEGNDAMNKLIDLYANGYVSGMATALASLASTVPEEVRHDFARRSVAASMADPLFVEIVRQEITETFSGTDSPEGVRRLSVQIPPQPPEEKP